MVLPRISDRRTYSSRKTASAFRGCAAMLIDPPRQGAIEVVKALGSEAPRRIVYVSCDPATLSRDAAVLVHRQGFRLAAAGVADMFPHTAHVESLALFVRPDDQPPHLLG